MPIVVGDLSRPSSAASKNKICDQEQNHCGCVEKVKQQQLNDDSDVNATRHRSTIETSTDTLVPEGDVEERLRARSSTLVAHDATLKQNAADPVTSLKEPVTRKEEQNLSEKPMSLTERRCKLETRLNNGNVTVTRPSLEHAAAGRSRLAQPWEVPFAAQERADAYFKNRFDTDGLPVHQTEPQRRLVAIYFTHQEQVQYKILHGIRKDLKSNSRSIM